MTDHLGQSVASEFIDRAEQRVGRSVPQVRCEHDWYFDMGPNYAGWWCSHCGVAIDGLDHPNEREESACAH